MRTMFVWTDYEEDIMLTAVKEATSVRVGLHTAAEALGTTFYICRNRWYSHTVHKYNEDKVTVSHEVEVLDGNDTVQVDTVQDVRESLEDFLGNLSNLVDENKRLVAENAELKRDNRNLVDENRQINESYTYILKVMDKARKLCLTEEETPKNIKYAIKDGAVEISSTA